MSIALAVKNKSNVGKISNKNVSISHSTINIILVNITEHGLDIDEIINRVIKELQQRALYDPRALEALKMVQQLVEGLKKVNSQERKISILKKILEIAAPFVDLFRVLANMLHH
jgi:acetyl-CoA carboxylase alpha subunit